MGKWAGVAIVLASSCLGGTAAAITRYLVGSTDPITLAVLRRGIGFACPLPVAPKAGSDDTDSLRRFRKASNECAR